MKKEKTKQFLRWCIAAAVYEGRLIRTQTEALSYCDDWYVGDKCPVLEKFRNQMQI